MEKSYDEEYGAVKKVRLLGSTRLGLAFISFFGCLNLYALRANISVAIVCMVNHTAVREVAGSSALKNASSSTFMYTNTSFSNTTFVTSSPLGYNLTTTSTPGPECEVTRAQAEDGTLLFDKHIQGLVLSSFFWGYIVTMFPGGWLATRFGGKRIWGVCMVTTAVATLLTPIAATTHYAFLIAIRFICGLGSGVSYPCIHAIWSRWAPPLERSKLVGLTAAGSWLGNVITYPSAGLLCKHGFAGGWPSIFYVFGGTTLLWAVVWFVYVTDDPEAHRRISKEEKRYIKASQEGTMDDNAKDSKRPPFKEIFTSAPVWGLIVCNICSDWGLYTFLTNLPTYLSEVLKFDIQSNGLYSSLPFLGFWLMTMFTGWLADFFRERKIMSTTAVRKLFQGTGFIIPAILIIPAGYLECDQAMGVIALLTVCVTMTGWQFGGGFLINAADFAPKYAGLIFGISNSIATISGFIVPVVIGAITKDGSKEQWRAVFYIAAAVYAFGAIIFFFIGSGEIQPWAFDKEEQEDKEEKEPMQLDTLANGEQKE